MPVRWPKIRAAMVGAAQGASADFEEKIGRGVPLKDALDSSGLAAAYNLVNAAPIAGILGRLGGPGSTIIQDMASAGLDNLFKDAFIEVLDEVRESEGMFYDEEKGEFFYKEKDAFVSFTVGNLLAMLTAMVLGK